MTVKELEPARFVSEVGSLVVTVTVATEAGAGGVDVTYWGATPLGLTVNAPVAIAPSQTTFLSGEEYPALVAIWDNDSDAVFDEI